MVDEAGRFARKQAKAVAEGRKGFRFKGKFFSVPGTLTPRQKGIAQAIQQGQFTSKQALALGLSPGDIRAATTGDTSLREQELNLRRAIAKSPGTAPGSILGIPVAALTGGVSTAKIARTVASLDAQSMGAVQTKSPAIQSPFAVIPIAVAKGTPAEAAIKAVGKEVAKVGVFSIENLKRVGGALGIATAGGLLGAAVLGGVQAARGRGTGIRRPTRSTNLITKRASKQINRLGKFQRQFKKIAPKLGLRVTLKRTTTRSSRGVITAREAELALRR